MPTEHRQKQFIYREAQVFGVDTPADPLDVLLKRAFALRELASQRRQAINEYGGKRVINAKRGVATMIAGDMLDFTTGNHPFVVHLDDTADEYILQQLAPPSELQEFLESVLYFGVIDDHVIIAQSTSLRAGQLEKHLQWLLRECTDVIPSGAQLKLLDRITPPVGVPPKKLQKVQSVFLKAQVDPNTAARVPATLGAGPRGVIEQTFRGLIPEQVRNLLTALTGAKELVVEELEVNVEIKRHGRRAIGDTRSVLDEIAEMLRHTDELPFELEVPGLGTISPNNLRLGKPVSIRHRDGAPDFEDVATKMHAWLIELIDRREVAARPRAPGA